MSNPRSSKRTSARIATFHVDDEIEISSSLLQNDSLDDRVSGAGPPALSLQSDADLTEVPDSFVHDESILSLVFMALTVFEWTKDMLLKKTVGCFRCQVNGSNIKN